MTLIDFDRRATHRVVSDPTVLDIANDADAHVQEGIEYVTRAHWLALAAGDAGLVDAINRVGARLHDLQALIHRGLDLYAESIAVDPYRAAELAAAERNAA